MDASRALKMHPVAVHKDGCEDALAHEVTGQVAWVIQCQKGPIPSKELLPGKSATAAICDWREE